jgi:hypothetical protein
LYLSFLTSLRLNCGPYSPIQTIERKVAMSKSLRSWNFSFPSDDSTPPVICIHSTLNYLPPISLLSFVPFPFPPRIPIQHDTSNHNAQNNLNYPPSTAYPRQSYQKTNTQYNAAHTQYYNKYYCYDIYQDSSRDWTLTVVRWFRCRGRGLRCSQGCRRLGSRLRRLGLS